MLTSGGDEVKSFPLVPDSPAISSVQVNVSLLPDMFVERSLPGGVRHHPILSVTDRVRSPSHPEPGTLETPTLRPGRWTGEDDSQFCVFLLHSLVCVFPLIWSGLHVNDECGRARPGRSPPVLCLDSKLVLTGCLPVQLVPSRHPDYVELSHGVNSEVAGLVTLNYGDLGTVFSTLIGRGPTRLVSHWSRAS